MNDRAPEFVIETLNRARKDILEALRYMRDAKAASDVRAEVEAEARAASAVIAAGIEVSWVLEKLGRLDSTKNLVAEAYDGPHEDREEFAEDYANDARREREREG